MSIELETLQQQLDQINKKIDLLIQASRQKQHLADMYRRRIPFCRNFTTTLHRFRKSLEIILRW